MKNINTFLAITVSLFILSGCDIAVAQKRTDAADNEGEVNAVLVSHDKNAIFSQTANFTYTIKNTYDKPEAGKVSYLVSTEDDRPIRTDSVKINISPNSKKSFEFAIADMPTGFYKVNFMVNVADYDDTTRRVFGIRPDQITSQHPKPADFDEFWQKTKDELAKVKPEFKMTEMYSMEKNDHKVFKVQMQSYGNVTIRGWLTEPASRPGYKGFPVLMGLPGYQVPLFPIIGMDDDLAIFTLDVRGQGDSKDDVNIRKADFVVNNIEDKNRYVMRGVIMDCIRAIDFIHSRPELRHNDLMVSGGSMGGFLTLAVSSLDKRVTMCSAQNPIMSDVYSLEGEVDWPVRRIKDYIAVKPGLTLQKVLSNLQYFDSKNFAATITCPTLIGIGLLDPIVPPNNAFTVYNTLRVKKKIIIFKDLAHEVDVRYKVYEAGWMNDTFGLF